MRSTAVVFNERKPRKQPILFSLRLCAEIYQLAIRLTGF